MSFTEPYNHPTHGRSYSPAVRRLLDGPGIAAGKSMAATWKGSISFGLVNIPIELYGAVTSHRPHFRLLHAKDKSPVNYERVCQREGKPVAWADLVKGYEYKKGKFVVLTKEDFQA